MKDYEIADIELRNIDVEELTRLVIQHLIVEKDIEHCEEYYEDYMELLERLNASDIAKLWKRILKIK